MARNDGVPIRPVRPRVAVGTAPQCQVGRDKLGHSIFLLSNARPLECVQLKVHEVRPSKWMVVCKEIDATNGPTKDATNVDADSAHGRISSLTPSASSPNGPRTMICR